MGGDPAHIGVHADLLLGACGLPPVLCQSSIKTSIAALSIDPNIALYFNSVVLVSL